MTDTATLTPNDDAQITPDTSMENPAPVEDLPAASTMSPQNLRVKLDFYLNSEMVSIGEISSWIQGAVVPFGQASLSSGMSVEIRNGTQKIARGNLVKLDDAYGIMIEESFIRKEPSSKSDM